jgi:thymidylate kinase
MSTALFHKSRRVHRLERTSGGKGEILSIVGPDGVGKTTLVDAVLAGVLADRAVMCIRRPGVLPRRTIPDVAVTEPHDKPPYPAHLSLAKLFYVFADYLLGWMLRVRPFVKRGGWVVVERGWWDIAVDPLRYRFRNYKRLLWLLGKVLPHPSVLLILEAPAENILARKAELTKEELDRQAAVWRNELPARQRRIYIDATQTADEVAAQASGHIGVVIESARSKAEGWVALPNRKQPRVFARRAPREISIRAFDIFHPMTMTGAVGRSAARALAATGGLRLIPRTTPPSDVMKTLRALPGDLETISIARTNHEGRFVALLGHGDTPTAVAKISHDPQGKAILAREADALRSIATHLPEPLSAPRVLREEDGVIVLEAARWKARRQPWRLEAEVAEAMGAFWKAGNVDGGELGFGHGDLAPWNLMFTDQGKWMLIDWEDARADSPVFEDILHHLIQSHALLGRPNATDLLQGLEGSGWVGSAVKAYASGAGVSIDRTTEDLKAYLHKTIPNLDERVADQGCGLRARRSLLLRLEGADHA